MDSCGSWKTSKGRESVPRCLPYRPSTYPWNSVSPAWTLSIPCYGKDGEARRIAVASLIRALFRAANRTPDVMLGLADEIPPLVFSRDIRVDFPVCRVSTDPAPRRGMSEEIEELGASLFLIWSTPSPEDGSAARRLLNLLAERPNPLEAFDRVAAGIAEAYRGR